MNEALSPACAACREPGGTCFPGPCKLHVAIQERRAGTSPIRVKPGETLTMTLAGRRTPKDYAVEFGEYIAKSAERYMAAVNSVESARESYSDQSMDDAQVECTEAYSRLQSDIYEFRKRKDRI